MIKKLGLFVGTVGIMFAPLATMASGPAPTSFDASEVGGVLSFSGSGWSEPTDVIVNIDTTDAYDPAGAYDLTCALDGTGYVASAICTTGVSLPDGTYYAYASNDGGATTVQATGSPFTIGTPPPPAGGGMDSGAMAAGMVSVFSDFTGGFGPLFLLIVGMALGLFGVRLSYVYLTNMVRARSGSETRRGRRRKRHDDV